MMCAVDRGVKDGRASRGGGGWLAKRRGRVLLPEGCFWVFLLVFWGFGFGHALLAQQSTSSRLQAVGMDGKDTYTLFQRSVSPLVLPEAIPELLLLQRPEKPEGRILGADGRPLSLVWPPYVEEKFRVLWQYAARPDREMPPWRWEIQRLLIEEAPAQAGHAKGELRLEAIFYALDAYTRPDTLFTFTNSLSYTRPLSRISYVDGLLYRALGGMRDYAERWLTAEQGRHPALARGIRVQPYLEERGTARDTIFYASGETLSWSDFRGRMSSGSRFNASIFTTLAMDYTASVENGLLTVPVRIRAFMLPRDSWVRPGGQSAYALNHEQRHFDMVQVVSLLLKGWLEGFVWSKADFEGQLNQAFMHAYRLMNRLQEAYDADTSHGQRKERQVLWDAALDQALEGDFQALAELYGLPMEYELLPP